MDQHLYVTYLCVDDARSPSPAVEPGAGVIHHPAWETIVQAIRQLDGDRIRLVILGERPPDQDTGMPYGGRGMVIGGGGSNGLYVCTAGEDDPDEQHLLVNPQGETQAWVEVMFGQPVTYNLQSCVYWDELIYAARHFAQTGQLAPDLTWRRT